MSEKDRKRFDAAVEFLRKYSAQYDFDWLMIAALAYQESRIDQSMRSAVGAIGVMQMLPSTAKDKNINIHDIEHISNSNFGNNWNRSHY
jgi:membrane-bound lytic murein transglycosylase MltF